MSEIERQDQAANQAISERQAIQTRPEPARPLVQIVAVMVAACVVFAAMQGVHDNYGVMLSAVMGTSGLSYGEVSLAIGIGALVYGLGQPLMGMLALRRGNATTMVVGIALMIVGFVVTPLCRSLLTLIVFFGLVLPMGTCGLASGILMGALTPVVGERRATIVSGVLQASAGVGDALMAPGLERGIAAFGIRPTLLVLVVPFAAMVPVALWMGRLAKGTDAAGDAQPAQEESFRQIITSAFADRSYRLILASFATCGFNMSIIESHLFSQYVSYGIPSQTASLALSVYGVATMLGALLTGALASRFPKGVVLGSTYAMRVFISLAFLFLPKSAAFAFVATAALGMSGDATVPPTMGIVSERFGAAKIGVLYGFALVGHQVGAFASAALGGWLVNAGLGYAPLWVANLLLAAFAATCAYLIRDQH